MKRTQPYDFEAIIKLTGWSRSTIKRKIRSGEFPGHDYYEAKGKKLWRVSKIERVMQGMGR